MTADGTPDFAALVAAASHPEAVVVIRCIRCKRLREASPDPDVRLCHPCLRQVQGLWIDDETSPSEEQAS